MSEGRKVVSGTPMKVYVNGCFSKAETIQQCPGEEAIGVFESMRTYHGRIFRLEEHLKRLNESCQTLNWNDKGLSTKIRQHLKRSLDHYGKLYPSLAHDDLFIRLSLWPIEAAPGLHSVILITQKKHAEKLYSSGVALRTSPVKRTHTNAASPQIKTSSYVNSVLASLEPRTEQDYEWVFLDADGFVTEVRIGNLFMVKNGELFTPPLRGILDGVTRRFVIECALQRKIKVYEDPLSRHDLYNADECFLCNTSWEILPVRSLDGRRIGREIPGNLTHLLQTVFHRKVNQLCPPQKSKGH